MILYEYVLLMAQISMNGIGVYVYSILLQAILLFLSIL